MEYIQPYVHFFFFFLQLFTGNYINIFEPEAICIGGSFAHYGDLLLDKLKEKIEEEDKDLKIVDKLPFNSNDLVVITAAKKLCAYVITITEKSPKKKLCCNLLNLELNNKTQIGKVNNGIDFLGFNHKLSNTEKIDVKLRASSKIRMKRYKKL